MNSIEEKALMNKRREKRKIEKSIKRLDNILNSIEDYPRYFVSATEELEDGIYQSIKFNSNFRKHIDELTVLRIERPTKDKYLRETIDNLRVIRKKLFRQLEQCMCDIDELKNN